MKTATPQWPDPFGITAYIREKHPTIPDECMGYTLTFTPHQGTKLRLDLIVPDPKPTTSEVTA